MSDAYLPGDTRQRIQDLIKDRKITQAELAENVGLSNSALSRYLQGNTKNLGDGFIIRIAKYFDVSTDFLLGETDIPDRKNYYIEELGLSAEASKLLYTGKVNASMLNQLIEQKFYTEDDSATFVFVIAQVHESIYCALAMESLATIRIIKANWD